jgi:hypothetical protein
MPESQRLIKPRFVQFNSLADDGETNLAFLFLVVHEDEGEHLSGFVFANDPRNTTGLSDGVNYRGQIGKGGPGINASWSEIEEE